MAKNPLWQEVFLNMSGDEKKGERGKNKDLESHLEQEDDIRDFFLPPIGSNSISGFNAIGRKTTKAPVAPGTLSRVGSSRGKGNKEEDNIGSPLRGARGNADAILSNKKAKESFNLKYGDY